MSQTNYDIVKGISQAAAEAYDGALDDKDQPLEIGLKREEGHPVLDSRQIDGFKVRISGATLVITYQSDIKLKDVYSTDLENELEQTMADIVKYLKKRYRAITGKSLGLKEAGEVDAMVQKTSRVRVFVTARKHYKISGMDGVEDVGKPSENTLDKNFRKFLEAGGSESKPKNVTRKKD